MVNVPEFSWKLVSSRAPSDRSHSRFENFFFHSSDYQSARSIILSLSSSLFLFISKFHCQERTHGKSNSMMHFGGGVAWCLLVYASPSPSIPPSFYATLRAYRSSIHVIPASPHTKSLFCFVAKHAERNNPCRKSIPFTQHGSQLSQVRAQLNIYHRSHTHIHSYIAPPKNSGPCFTWKHQMIYSFKVSSIPRKEKRLNT